MKYLGGKSRIANYIVKELNDRRKEGQLYLEPFVGAANVLERMDNPRIGSDIDPDIINYLSGIRDGYVPLENVSEELYYKVKETPEKYPPALIAHVKYGCSWGAKPWGGYARGTNRNYAKESYSATLKQAPKLHGAVFQISSYYNWKPQGCLIYCDPPYQKTTGYGLDFDHVQFWNIMVEWSRNNTVLVSEYTAPEGFVSVWEKETVTMRGAEESKKEIEKLFMYEEYMNVK